MSVTSNQWIQSTPMLLAKMLQRKVSSFEIYINCESFSAIKVNVPLWIGLSCGTISPSTIHSSDDQSECQARDISVDSGYGTSYLVKVRGLPWTTTKKDLRDFLANVQISNELDGIHFITDDQHNFGVAYIQLATRKDYERVQSFHRKKLGDRYIEG